MPDPNPIEELDGLVRQIFPDAEVSVDPPLSQKGTWYLDVVTGTIRIVLGWRPGQQIGLSVTRPGQPVYYGEGFDELHRGADSALARIINAIDPNRLK